MVQSSDMAIKKVASNSFNDAKKARNQKQREEKRFSALQTLIPELEEKIKVLDHKIATDYATDYVELEKATKEKEEAESLLLSLLEEYYSLEEIYG